MASKPNLASIISEVLRSAGKPMTAGTVFAEIQSNCRSAKQRCQNKAVRVRRRKPEKGSE